MMRAGKPLGNLNDDVKCINMMGPPDESITREEYQELCRKAHGVTMIDDIPCVGRSPTFETIPTKEWNEILRNAKSNPNVCIDPAIGKDRSFTKGTLYNDTPRKLPPQPTITLPRWAMMFIMTGAYLFGMYTMYILIEVV